MNHAEVIEILGLEKHWLLGGTGARFYWSQGGVTHQEVIYFLRPAKPDPRIKGIAAGTPVPAEYLHCPAMIELRYTGDPGMRYEGGVWRGSNTGKLVNATFSDGITTIAEMPK